MLFCMLALLLIVMNSLTEVVVRYVFVSGFWILEPYEIVLPGSLFCLLISESFLK